MGPTYVVLWNWFGDIQFEEFTSRAAAIEKFEELSKKDECDGVRLLQELWKKE